MAALHGARGDRLRTGLHGVAGATSLELTRGDAGGVNCISESMSGATGFQSGGGVMEFQESGLKTMSESPGLPGLIEPSGTGGNRRAMASTKSISRQPAKSEGTKVAQETEACGRKDPGVPCAGAGDSAQLPGAGEGQGDGESGPAQGLGNAVEQQSSSQVPFLLPFGVAGLCGSSESNFMNFACMAAGLNISRFLRWSCFGLDKAKDGGPL